MRYGKYMISFTNLTKKRVHRAVFEKLYRKTMPKGFELSVVFAPPALMKKLNKQYRGKDKVANVLSFELGSPTTKLGAGEIFLNVREKDLPYLFVHGCLHLLSYDHQKNKDALRMESLEQKILHNRR